MFDVDHSDDDDHNDDDNVDDGRTTQTALTEDLCKGVIYCVVLFAGVTLNRSILVLSQLPLRVVTLVRNTSSSSCSSSSSSCSSSNTVLGW
ncbi:hypothetical protein M0802_013251 [Mischocyttarus mexicanus]|nr:hypothetical protein M0802_013251 [Mischocyttarus mexicanus]